MSPAVTLTAEHFGDLTDDLDRSVSVQKFTWQTAAGLRLSVINLDAAIIELCVPDRTWKSSVNVLLGVENLDEYLQLDPTLVCAAHFEHGWPTMLMGKGSSVDGRSIDLKRVWHPFVDGTRLHLSVVRKSSNLNRNIFASVTISVEPSNVVRIQYRTCSGLGSILRLSHRFLFNLGGHDAGPTGTFDHVVQLNAKSYVDEKRNLRTTVENVADMRIAQHLGLILYKARNEGVDGMERIRGIYALENAIDDGYAVRLIHTTSGRALELYCDFPWLYFSTLDNLPKAKDRSIEPFYPREGLQRLSLVFELDGFILSVLKGIEPSVDDVNEEQERESDADGSLNETTIRSGRYLKNDGLLLHPLACPFQVKRNRSSDEQGHTSRHLPFVGHVTLKFGICRPVSKDDSDASTVTN